MGARDFLATFTRPCNLMRSDLEMGARKPKDETEKRNENGEIIAVMPPRQLTEASVVMLSNSAGMTNSSIRQFMQYIYNAHDVHSALLKYHILKDVKPDSQCKSKTGSEGHICNCIVISKVEGINMPRELPSLQCLENECHGCNVEFSSAVCDALYFEFTTPTQKDPICICIPVHPASGNDKWTKLLARCLKNKDQGDKGAIVAAADALQNYLDRPQKRAEDKDEGRAEKRAEDREVRAEGSAEDTDEGRAEEIKYKTVSLIVIRLVEILINVVLNVFFKVDGFSSALAARRVVRSYVVDAKGNGLPANVFLTSGLVVVKSDSVCQVLKFRSNTTILSIVGCANLFCAIRWVVVLIAFNGGKWYAVTSMPPSKPRVAVIIAAICIGIVMDCFELSKRTLKKIWKIKKKENQNTSMILGVIILEIVFAVVVGLGLNKGIERWVYGALQLLVWVKWGIGSSILGAYCPDSVSRSSKRGMSVHGRIILEYPKCVDEGSLVYSSSFLLNAVMVAVMADWSGFWTTWTSPS